MDVHGNICWKLWTWCFLELLCYLEQFSSNVTIGSSIKIAVQGHGCHWNNLVAFRWPWTAAENKMYNDCYALMWENNIDSGIQPEWNPSHMIYFLSSFLNLLTLLCLYIFRFLMLNTFLAVVQFKKTWIIFIFMNLYFLFYTILYFLMYPQYICSHVIPVLCHALTYDEDKEMCW